MYIYIYISRQALRRPWARGDEICVTCIEGAVPRILHMSCAVHTSSDYV